MHSHGEAPQWLEPGEQCLLESAMSGVGPLRLRSPGLPSTVGDAGAFPGTG